MHTTTLIQPTSKLDSESDEVQGALTKIARHLCQERNINSLGHELIAEMGTTETMTNESVVANWLLLLLDNSTLTPVSKEQIL